MPGAVQGLLITDPAQLSPDTVGASEIAANSVGDSEVAAHTTTKITVPEANISGPLAIARGGTGQATQTPAFDALAPTTTEGDIIYHNGTDNVRLAKGSALQQLRMNAGATAPEWAAPAAVTFINTQVYSGNTPTSTTALDLSATVGATTRLVLLQITANVSATIHFVTSGLDNTAFDDRDAANTMHFISGQNQTLMAWCKTNSSGVIDWDATGAVSVALLVVAYL